MQVVREREELDSQLSGFNSPFWTLAMQDAKAVGEEGGDLGFNWALWVLERPREEALEDGDYWVQHSEERAQLT